MNKMTISDFKYELDLSFSFKNIIIQHLYHINKNILYDILQIFYDNFCSKGRYDMIIDISSLVPNNEDVNTIVYLLNKSDIFEAKEYNYNKTIYLKLK